MARSSSAIWRRALSKRWRKRCSPSSSAPATAIAIARIARVRIVGGSHRGRRLAVPPGIAVRPTSDRTREALFDILSHGTLAVAGLPFADRAVLDAFAGTGAF